MKTVITEKIDGHDIVIGFDNPVVDDVATKEKIETDIKDTHEFALLEIEINKLNAIKDEIINVENEIKSITSIAVRNELKKSKVNYSNSSQSDIMRILNSDEKSKITIRESKIRELLIKHDNAGKEKTNASLNLELKFKELKSGNPVFFEPKIGEYIIKYDEYVRLKNIVFDNPKKLVDRHGNIYCDYRGVKYVVNDQILEITNIGIEPEGIPVSELSEDEFDRIRIKNMTHDEKEKEFQMLSDCIIEKAGIMKSRLEIQGITDALKQSQAWYNEEMNKLKIKYGIE